MESFVKEYQYLGGELQRVQMVILDHWAGLEFLPLQLHKEALGGFADIYTNFLVPVCPWIFGQMIMVRMEGLGHEEIRILEKGIQIKGGSPVCKTPEAEELWEQIRTKGQYRIICGKLPFTKVIPLGDKCGYLTESQDAQMKVNGPFFIMDPIDCATVYDRVGTPLGLQVKNGQVMNPPLFGREALLVDKNGQVTIREMNVGDLEIEVAGKRYKNKENSRIYTRPESKKAPGKKGTVNLVIVGNTVVDVRENQGAEVPASGFVLGIAASGTNSEELRNRPVIYHGLEQIAFGIQVGNSVIRDGVKTEKFISRFYNLYHLEPVPYPPSLYPMDFAKARAARMVLGADRAGHPVILWAEGAAKFGYEKGKGSCGASLSELGTICEDLGLYQAINLDGGGSAQLLVQNKRTLMISDRKREDHSEAERAIPMGLCWRQEVQEKNRENQT